MSSVFVLNLPYYHNCRFTNRVMLKDL